MQAPFGIQTVEGRSKMATGAKEQRTRKRYFISPHLYEAVIFDLDGVVTQTAKVHAAAWKALFDEYLQVRSRREGVIYRPFDIRADYLEYIDGKPRYDGVYSFLQSRGIRLPFGNLSDLPEQETVCALGNRKNQFFLTMLGKQGVEIYESTVALIEALKREGIKTGIISASKNCALILEKAGLQHLFDTKVDGVDAEVLGLQGKPAPDVFLQAARQLNVESKRTAIVEDALAGVQAGKAGHFKLVIGVDRGGQAERLKASGADIVVPDLAFVSIGESGVFDEVERGEADLDFRGEKQDYWRLSYNGFEAKKEGLREALCALGNGYFVTRGAAPESRDDGIHYPGTYVAGLYNRLINKVAGKKFEHEDLVNLPNWLSLTFRIGDDAWFDLKVVEILSYRQTLDMREGVLYRHIRFRDAHGRVTRLEERRLVHMRHFHLAALETRLTAENWSGCLTIRSALDGRVVNNNVERYRYLRKKHLQPVACETSDNGLLYLKTRTSQSEIQIAQAAKTRVRWENGAQPLQTESQTFQEAEYGCLEMLLAIPKQATIIIDKTVALYTSRDPAISEPGLEAKEAIRNVPEFDELVRTQIEAWKHLWQLFDIEIEMLENNGDIPTALILHLHIFHFLQTASPNSVDLDIGIPARGWHGEGYQGHIFWDDMYVFPFLNLRKPEITEALLKYRYRRLNMARRRALAEGLKGALFPWQSASNGREETVPYVLVEPDSAQWREDNTWMQKHVNAAIAYNIWQYYQVTGDIEFLNSYGAEILLEIARLFASLSSYNPELDRYEIKGIMGPDEYHDAYPESNRKGIDNNAYTNVMAVWVLCRALELLKVMPVDQRRMFCEKLDIQDSELMLWDAISRKMRLVIQPSGIISQFEGYENLDEFPLERTVEEVLLESGATLNRYKMSKQADVLMLFYVFSSEELAELFERMGYDFSPNMIPKNIDYYIARTAHNSTLSRVVYAWVLSRADRKRSWALFREALQSDVADIQGGTTQEGIHLGAMAGTVDIIQRCYTGLVMRQDVLWLNPCLPDQLQRMSFCIHYRKQSLHLELNRDRLYVTARYSAAAPIKLGFKGHVHELHAGECKEFHMPQGGCVR
jgi:beta-phosphoglucomutase family hydrolase